MAGSDLHFPNEMQCRQHHRSVARVGRRNFSFFFNISEFNPGFLWSSRDLPHPLIGRQALDDLRSRRGEVDKAKRSRGWLPAGRSDVNARRNSSDGKSTRQPRFFH